jgi:hypothetical protein
MAAPTPRDPRYFSCRDLLQPDSSRIGRGARIHRLQVVLRAEAYQLRLILCVIAARFLPALLTFLRILIDDIWWAMPLFSAAGLLMLQNTLLTAWSVGS